MGKKLSKLEIAMAKDDGLKISINLNGKPKETLTGVFLKWAIQIGRIIIVATELMALGALFFRFTIDRKIIDLHDQIKREELFVKSQQGKEKEYRSIQERLTNIKNTETETKTKITLMNQILKTISEGAFQATNLTVSQNTISISATAYSIFPVNSFIDSLKQNPNIVSISIDEITSTDSGIQFKLNIELKQLAKKV